ncbi:hypothetical protein HGB07_08995 [Candidatus Roizmanbacteria bacterium]|nr:hypothetical protein [Candidatus Roizmanbacteria bacterium]
MHSNPVYVTTTNVLIVMIFLAVGIYYIFLKIDDYMHMVAINDCAKLSTFQKSNPSDNTVVSYPVPDVYQACLKDKGIVK